MRGLNPGCATTNIIIKEPYLKSYDGPLSMPICKICQEKIYGEEKRITIINENGMRTHNHVLCVKEKLAEIGFIGELKTAEQAKIFLTYYYEKEIRDADWNDKEAWKKFKTLTNISQLIARTDHWF